MTYDIAAMAYWGGVEIIAIVVAIGLYVGQECEA